MMRYSIMKLFLLIFALLTFAISSQAQYTDCKLLVDPEITLINGRNNASMVKPGDTICLKQGVKSFLLLSFLHGSKEEPIVIQNVDGLVFITGGPNYGVKFDSCSFVKFSGSGISTLKYGIIIDKFTGAGMSVDGLSTDIEIEAIEISNVGLAGIFAKTEPNCLFNSTRDKYTMRNLRIHDCHIRATGMEGMYIGSSKYSGQVINCNGKDTTVLPHLIKGVSIYRNLVQETGWDGIQVSSADSGCVIYENDILNDSKLAETYQMSGILVGGGTAAQVYNNYISDGYGDGIDVASMGTQYIFNNLIINPGRSYKPDQNYSPYLKHGIYIGPDYTATANSYKILFNTIVSPKSFGVRFTDNLSTQNIIANNIVVDPGSYPTAGESSYFNFTSTSVDVTLFNNITNRDINYLNFTNPGEGKYDLQASSPAVNTGVPVAGFDLFFDYMNRIRPFAKYYDIGAFECQDSSLLGLPKAANPAQPHLVIFPNPSYGHFKIAYTLSYPSDITIWLNDIQGRIIMKRIIADQHPGEHNINMQIESLQAGFYSLIFQTNQSTTTRKLIILNN